MDVHATSFFLSISEKCSYIRDCSCTCMTQNEHVLYTSD